MSLISHIPLLGFVCSHKGPTLLPECNEMLVPDTGNVTNVTKCNGMKMSYLWNAINPHKM